MICPITKAPVCQGVASPFGHLFEKEAILEHLDHFQHCPVTGQPLSKEQLVELRMPETQVPSMSEDLGSLLKHVEQQYQNLALQNFYTKQQIEKLNLEIAHAVFRKQAAQLVVSRLLQQKEALLAKTAPK